MDDDLAAAVADVFEVAGVSVVYNDGDSPPRAIPGIVSYGEDLDDDRFRTAVQASGTLEVLESDVSRPEYGHTVEIGGEVWSIVSRLGRTAGKWRLEIRRDLRPTFRR